MAEVAVGPVMEGLTSKLTWVLVVVVSISEFMDAANTCSDASRGAREVTGSIVEPGNGVGHVVGIVAALPRGKRFTAKSTATTGTVAASHLELARFSCVFDLESMIRSYTWLT